LYTVYDDLPLKNWYSSGSSKKEIIETKILNLTLISTK
jgi:hypothetical protein